jgi:hypothetical protein
MLKQSIFGVDGQFSFLSMPRMFIFLYTCIIPVFDYIEIEKGMSQSGQRLLTATEKVLRVGWVRDIYTFVAAAAVRLHLFPRMFIFLYTCIIPVFEASVFIVCFFI